MPAKNLVVGFCTNMPVDRIAVLCRSVRRVLPPEDTEIVLITNDPDFYAEGLRGLDVSFHLTTCDHSPTTRKTEKLFKRIGVHSARFLADGFIDRKLWGGACARFLPTMLGSWTHPLTARWVPYGDVLKERPYAERVLLTDTKDVVVQADCFTGLDGDVVQLFQEGFPVAEERWNAAWIEQGYGKAALKSMEGVEAFCAGTILGARGALLRFVERLQSMFMRYPYRTVDQATINWLLHKEGDPEYVVRTPNLTGAVGTISSDAAKNSVEVRDGLIVRRSDGSTIPIVHMWDRWVDLETAVLNRYRT